jgi:hypothetical protein
LPANATHLFQLLVVAVFASFKGKLRGFVEAFMNSGGGYRQRLTKPASLTDILYSNVREHRKGIFSNWKVYAI